MKSNPCFSGICLFALIGAMIGSLAAQEFSSPPHLTLARQLLARVTPERNLYTARPTRIIWPDEATSDKPVLNHSVCSSFGAALLRKTYQLGKVDLVRLFDEEWPEADEMFAGITSKPEFKQLSLIKDVVPGDFWLVDYQSEKAIPTGHVMLVSGTPSKFASHQAKNLPFKFATDAKFRSLSGRILEWHVKVIDSSKSPHGRGDTRSRADQGEEDTNGLGEGFVRLLTDKTGKPLGYTWSTSSSSRLWLVSDRPIAFGRWVKQGSQP